MVLNEVLAVGCSWRHDKGDCSGLRCAARSLRLMLAAASDSGDEFWRMSFVQSAPFILSSFTAFQFFSSSFFMLGVFVQYLTCIGQTKRD